ncbi:DNA-binding transcriptional MerR regulator [Rhodococcus sp. PvP016]|uniref:DNA-binding transcriptional MerR regulator n=1 Tax=Rhodococcoides corynebacterioides TaxID=53972 RepID=A0ABS2KW61_9NOCA|nr:DNA-binding transcriptional MerR regulator [Rhodococcus corynebacterioides]MBP1117963.1 DNA-binding transcriptional MerR regulator [Rhodococcus sp. PvP016]
MHAAALDAFVALRRGHGYTPAVEIMRAVHARDDASAYRTIDAGHAALHTERRTYSDTADALEYLSTAAPRPIEGRPMTVGELARRLDLHPATLRAWEAEGIVRPTRSPTTGYREYDAEAVRDAEIARQLRRGDYRLSQVADFLTSLRGAGGVDALRSFLDAWQTRLTARSHDFLVGAARLDAYLRLRDHR